MCCAGVTGYLGSVVLEQLLRCVPGVVRVYVLVRPRGALSAQARVQRLFGSGLFHMLRDKPGARAKVSTGHICCWHGVTRSWPCKLMHSRSH